MYIQYIYIVPLYTFFHKFLFRYIKNINTSFWTRKEDFSDQVRNEEQQFRNGMWALFSSLSEFNENEIFKETIIFRNVCSYIFK